MSKSDDGSIGFVLGSIFSILLFADVHFVCSAIFIPDTGALSGKCYKNYTCNAPYSCFTQGNEYGVCLDKSKVMVDNKPLNN